jgi:lysophospholipase L1-like esterase
MSNRAFLIAAWLIAATPAASQTVVRTDTTPAALHHLPSVTVGRVQHVAGDIVRRQWPGTYFETAVRGPALFFKVGAGQVSLRVTVDHSAPIALVRPSPGLYRIAGIGRGMHRVRVAVASESQEGPTEFGGFYAARGVSAASIARRPRQIEFIGDSQTVGYGNSSPVRECSEDQVWATTDTTRGVAADVAARYGADYQVNAISGRGIVRNYNGFAAPTLPQAYPFVLFDKTQRYSDPVWKPQVIVVSLGTNDFSTALNPGEKWATRDALHRDFEATFARFLADLRRRNPHARLVLWATDMAEGEILAEVRKVAARVTAAGESRLDVVAVPGLTFGGCNYHPTVADDMTVAAALAKAIDAHPRAWAR